MTSNPDEENMDMSRGPFRNRRTVVLAVSALVIAIAGFAGYILVSSSRSTAGRPVPAPATVRFGSDDTSPSSSGGTLTLQAEQVANAGIRTEEVMEVPVDSSGAINGTGVLSADAYADVPVIAVGSGSVTEVFVELGDSVRRGSKLATVVSDEFARAEGDYIASVSAEENAKRNLERAQRLVGVNAPGRSEYENSLKDKIAAEASLAEARARYDRSSRLLEIGSISREQFEQETSRFKAAEAEAARAESRLKRAEELLSVSPEVRREEEQAREAYLRASGERASADARLRMFGLAESDIDALGKRKTPTGILTVRAQSSGTITFRNCNVGQVLQKDQEFFRITDLSKLWFVAQAFEQDADGLRVGMSAEVVVGNDSRPRAGRVVFIDPKVNETTRTVQVRIELANDERSLRIGTLATASLLKGGATEKGIAVKRSSVQRIGRDDVVFVAGADERTFEMRPVRIGSESSGLIRIVEGLKVGERIVVEGSFLLRAEWLKRNPL